MSVQTFKILVTGPFAAGKTSLIQSVSQTAVVSTDVDTSGEESDVKAHTTVAMDFGTYSLDDDDVRLLLFGTPGQPRFRFMTEHPEGRRRHRRLRDRCERHRKLMRPPASNSVRCCAICASRP